jgi:hypothetical protein
VASKCDSSFHISFSATTIRYYGTLCIKDFRLCGITSLTDRAALGIIPQEAFEMGGLPIDCTNTKVPDQLWCTLVADRGPDGINPPAWYP